MLDIDMFFYNMVLVQDLNTSSSNWRKEPFSPTLWIQGNWQHFETKIHILSIIQSNTHFNKFLQLNIFFYRLYSCSCYS